VLAGRAGSPAAGTVRPLAEARSSSHRRHDLERLARPVGLVHRFGYARPHQTGGDLPLEERQVLARGRLGD